MSSFGKWTRIKSNNEDSKQGLGPPLHPGTSDSVDRGEEDNIVGVCNTIISNFESCDGNALLCDVYTDCQ